jgi:hypothetical protein
MSSASFAAGLAAIGVSRPRHTVAWATALVLVLGWSAAGLESEVGYPAYFGPRDPAVQRLEAFLDEFQSGLHVWVVFGCSGSELCRRVDEEAALRFVGKLQAALDAVPHVRRTRSLLDAPIVVAPLTTRTIARREMSGEVELADDWRELVARAPGEPLVEGVLVAEDARTAGILVELTSLESGPLRTAVHGILAATRLHEAELGAEIYVAGDPVWSVLSDDALDADSRNLTLLMFVVIIAVLWVCFRDAWLTVLPVLCVAALTVAVHGVLGVLRIPMTTILAALPPLLVVIAVTASIHLLSAYLREPDPDAGVALVAASARVGPACFWAALTTAIGFGSFVWSDLVSFRHFGLAAGVGLALSFLCTFTCLPALVVLRAGSARRPSRARLPVRQVEGALALARARPGFLVAVSVFVLVGLVAGLPRLRYAVDFGDQSYVLRSVRFIEANLGRPMTTELSVTVPPGQRIYGPQALALLDDLESWFAREPTTGRAWSFLDFLEEAYRMDRGSAAGSFAELVAAAPAEMPWIAAYEDVASFWSERRLADGGPGEWRDRARVSVRRSWLDAADQVPYVERLRAFVEKVDARVAGDGFRVEFEGGLELAALAEERIRSTQWRSFASAFLLVSAILIFLLRRRPWLATAAVLANVLPVLSLLGLMGWVGIGIDPANTMVAAVLLGIVVDDTLHVAFGIDARGGPFVRGAVAGSVRAVGPALCVTSACLALGFAVLMFSRWGGLVSFGLLASAGIGLALAADLLVLPAALLLAAERRREP